MSDLMILVDNILPKPLSELELHQLAMNIVGKDLEKDSFEFLSVNSKLKKDPQFVCLKNKKLFFVVVKAVSYPQNPKNMDKNFIKKLKDGKASLEKAPKETLLSMPFMKRRGMQLRMERLTNSCLISANSCTLT